MEVLKDQQRANPRYVYDPNESLSEMQHTMFVDENGNDVSLRAKTEHPELLTMHQTRAALRTEIMDIVHFMDRTKKAIDYKVAEEKKKILLDELKDIDNAINDIRKTYMDSITKVIPAQVAMGMEKS